MPMRRIEVFDRFKRQAGGANFAFEPSQLLDGPQTMGVASRSPARFGPSRLIRVCRLRTGKIVHEMGYDMRGAGLSREAKVLARQHMTIQPQAELHRSGMSSRLGITL